MPSRVPIPTGRGYLESPKPVRATYAPVSFYPDDEEPAAEPTPLPSPAPRSLIPDDVSQPSPYIPSSMRGDTRPPVRAMLGGIDFDNPINDAFHTTLGSGMGMVSTMAGALGADSEVALKMRSEADEMMADVSPETQAEREWSDAYRNAQKTRTAKLGATIANAVASPLQTSAEVAGGIAPALAATAAATAAAPEEITVGGLVTLGALARGGVEAAISLGNTKTQAFERAMSAPELQDLPYEDRFRIASKVQSYAESPLEMLGSAAGGFAMGIAGPEAEIAKITASGLSPRLQSEAIRAVEQAAAAKTLEAGAARAVGGLAAREGVAMGARLANEKLMANLADQGGGVKVDTLEGVPEAGIQGALMGAPLGALAGAGKLARAEALWRSDLPVPLPSGPRVEPPPTDAEFTARTVEPESPAPAAPAAATPTEAASVEPEGASFADRVVGDIGKADEPKTAPNIEKASDVHRYGASDAEIVNALRADNPGLSVSKAVKLKDQIKAEAEAATQKLPNEGENVNSEAPAPKVANYPEEASLPEETRRATDEDAKRVLAMIPEGSNRAIKWQGEAEAANLDLASWLRVDGVSPEVLKGNTFVDVRKGNQLGRGGSNLNADQRLGVLRANMAEGVPKDMVRHNGRIKSLRDLAEAMAQRGFIPQVDQATTLDENAALEAVNRAMGGEKVYPAHAQVEGAAMHENAAALENLSSAVGATPARIREALERGGGNRLELAVRDALRKQDPFGTHGEIEMRNERVGFPGTKKREVHDLVQELRQANGEGASDYGPEYVETAHKAIDAAWDLAIQKGAAQPVHNESGPYRGLSLLRANDGTVLIRGERVAARVSPNGSIDVASSPEAKVEAGRVMQLLFNGVAEGRIKNAHINPMSDDTLRSIATMLRRRGVKADTIAGRPMSEILSMIKVGNDGRPGSAGAAPIAAEDIGGARRGSGEGPGESEGGGIARRDEGGGAPLPDRSEGGRGAVVSEPGEEYRGAGRPRGVAEHEAPAAGSERSANAEANPAAQAHATLGRDERAVPANSGDAGQGARTAAVGRPKEARPRSDEEGQEGTDRGDTGAVAERKGRPLDQGFGTPDPETGRKFTSTEIKLPPAAAARVKALAARIAEKDLAGDGREENPHVTVKYGLHTNDPRDLSNVGNGPVRVVLGKTSFFPASESGEYDVVKVDVSSPSLHALNREVSAAVPVTDTHPDYRPHVTLAYVKPGLGKKYAGNRELEGIEFTADSFDMATRDGKEHEIPLANAAIAREGDESYRRPSTEKTKAGTQTLLPGAAGVMDTTGKVGKLKKGQSDVSRGPLFTQDDDAAARAEAESQGRLFEPARAYGSLTQGDEAPFFSQLQRVVDDPKFPAKGPASSYVGYLRDPKRGVKADEMKWTGLDDFLKERGQKPTTAAEIREFLKANAVEVEEYKYGQGTGVSAEDQNRALEWFEAQADDGKLVEGELADYRKDIRDAARGDRMALGNLEGSALPENLLNPFHEQYPSDSHGPAKFAQYQLPGGKNYREVLLTLPAKPIPESKEPRVVWNTSWDGLNLTGYIPTTGRTFILSRLEPNRRWLLRTSDGSQDSFATIDEAKAEAERVARNILGTPDTVNFRQGHWDEPNVLAHVRLNDRTIDGKRTLFVEEIQSDWAQKGRRHGFDKRAGDTSRWRAEEDADTGTWNVYDERGNEVALSINADDRADAIRIALEFDRAAEAEEPRATGVPPAPFIEKTEGWTDLAVKRILRMAAEEGYDQVAFTTGDQQADRYDLSKHIDRLRWYKDGDKYRVTAEKNKSTVLAKRDLDQRDLAETVGKDIADRIVASGDQHGVMEGLDLKVGGEGMKSFYDKIVPQAFNKIGKKFGAKVGEARLNVPTKDFPSAHAEMIRIARERGLGHPDSLPRTTYDEIEREAVARNTRDRGVVVHSLDITDEMRRSVMQGQALFEPKGGKVYAHLPDGRPYEPARTRRGAVRDARQAVLDFEPLQKDTRELRGLRLDAGSGTRRIALSATFPKELRTRGWVDLRGGSIREARDLAILARVFRDPRFETFRIFYTDDDGKILAHEALTSRFPGAVQPFQNPKRGLVEMAARMKRGLVEMAARMKRIGATKYWLLHNHPSGRPEPSHEDVRMTRAFDKTVPGLQGHVVIDGNEYGQISPSEASRVFYQTSKMVQPLKGPDVSPDAFFNPIEAPRKIDSPEAFALFAKGFRAQAQDDKVVVIVTDPGFVVRGVTSVPMKLFQNREEFGNWARGEKLAIGGSHLFVDIARSDAETKGLILHYVRSRTITDATLSGPADNGYQNDADYARKRANEPRGMGLKTFRANEPEAPYDEDGEESGPPISLPGETRLQLVERQLRNDLNRIGVVHEAASKQTGIASPKDLQSGFEGIKPRSQAQADYLYSVLAKPIMKQIAKDKLDYKLLGEFAMARHAPDRDRAILNTHIMERATEKNDGVPPASIAEARKILRPDVLARIEAKFSNGSGMPPERVKEIFAKVKATGKEAKYLEARDKILTLYDTAQRLLVAGGLTTPDRVAALREKFGPEFVSLRSEPGVDAEGMTPMDRFLSAGRGVTVKGPEWMQAKGRTTEATTHPLVSGVQAIERAIIRTERNHAMNDFAKWVSEVGSEDLGRVVPGPAKDENGVTFKRGGEDTSIELADPLTARALNRLSANQLDFLTQTMGGFTRWFSRVNTQLSVPFVFRNQARDYGGAVLSSYILHGMKRMRLSPDVEGESIPAYVALHQPQALAAAWRYMRGPGKAWPKGSIEADFHEGLMNGAVPGYLQTVEPLKALHSRLTETLKDALPLSESLKLTKDELKDALADPTVGPLVKAAKVVGAGAEAAAKISGFRRFLNALKAINEIVEAATRLNYYRALKLAGTKPRVAADHARQLIDFSRRGEVSPSLNALYAFFHANVEGTARMAEFFRHKDPEVRARAYKAVAAMFGAGFLWGTVGAMLSGDQDKDGIPDSDQLPEWASERAVVTPAITNLGPIMFPLPQGFSVPFYAGLMTSKMVRGTMRPGRAAGLLANALTNAFSPLPGEGLVPTALQPAFDVARNKDWRDRPINPERFPGQEGLPDSSLAMKRTSPIAKRVAEGLNRLTGGSDVKPGLADVGPGSLEHYYDFFAGGAGRFLSELAGAVDSFAHGQPPAKIPVVSSFLLDTTAGERQRFYDQVEHMAEIENRAKEKERGARIDQVKAKRPDADVDRMSLTEIRKSMDAAGMPFRPTPEWVKASRDEVEANMLKLKPLADAAEKRVRELNGLPQSVKRDEALRQVYEKLNREYVKLNGGKVGF